MKISRSFLGNAVFLSAVFLLGFGAHMIYVPLLFLYVLISPSYIVKPKINHNFFITFLLISVFLIPQYIIGYQYITLDSPVLSMLSVIFGIFVFGLIGQQLSAENVRAMIVLLVLGIGFEALVTVLYSYYSDPYLYGYALLYNPVLNREVNSPGVALKIAVLASVFIWFLFEKKGLIQRIFFLTGFIILSLLAAWLTSRAYFVIVGLSLVIGFVFFINSRNTISVVLITIIAAFVLPLAIESLDVSIFNRLNRLSGSLASPRFLLWQDGFKKMLSHPLGGFSVDQTIDNVRWFHNVFLDAARLAGWLPVISLILFVLYSFYLFLLRKNEQTFFAGFLFAIVFALVQQDVVVESMVRFIVLLFFCSILLSIRD